MQRHLVSNLAKDFSGAKPLRHAVRVDAAKGVLMIFPSHILDCLVSLLMPTNRIWGSDARAPAHRFLPL